jgi:hypothetical protein
MRTSFYQPRSKLCAIAQRALTACDDLVALQFGEKIIINKVLAQTPANIACSETDFKWLLVLTESQISRLSFPSI